MRQLDSLRAVALGLVTLSHWLPQNLKGGVPLGAGVHLFFVLSGFLITGILLDYRAAREARPEITRLRILGVFYARRSLRIFPLFYATLAVALLLDLGEIRRLWPWHAAYLSNVYYLQGGAIDPFYHFWSLAVEEQFYLVWPAVILFLPQRALGPVLFWSFAIAPIFRAGAEAMGHHFNHFPVSCLDALGAGAWLAGAKRGAFALRDLAGSRAAWVVAIIGFATATAALTAAGAPFVWIRSLGHTGLVLVFAALVWFAADGIGGVAGAVLNWRPLVFVGQISYGLYVFHPFFATTNFAPVLTAFGLPASAGDHLAVRLVLQAGCTLALGLASWFLLEKPLNDLRHRVRLPAPPG